MGLFFCCVGDRKQSQDEENARRARIVEIYNEAVAENESQEARQLPPPAYHELVYDSFSGTTIIVDEKPVPQPPSDTRAQNLRPAISRPVSPHTSIYSVPSTRLTDITATHTGQTITVNRTHQGGSPRSSLVFDSAPPSYYDGRSMRERSRSPDMARRSGEQDELHLVMARNWLDILLHNAEQAHAQVNN